MDSVELAGLLADAMDDQAHQLRRFADAESDLRNRVVDRAPAGDHMQAVHVAIDELRRLTANIERSDNERDSVFLRLRQELGVADSARLRDVIAWLPEKARVGVQLSFNALRAAASGVRGTSDRLGHLFRSISGTMGALIDELLPGVSGAGYAADGRRIGLDQPSLLVDQHR
jgi:hypothetical protein